MEAYETTSLEKTTPTDSVHVDELFRLTARMEASDIHLKVGRPPVLRIHGELVYQDSYDPLEAEDMQRLYEQVTNPQQRQHFERELELDLSYELHDVARYRVNIARQRGTITIVARRLAMTIPNIEDLGLPAVCKELVMKPRGLILVTGPTGSGKSTTLAAMIDYLNAREARRIITCEDPIEYIFEDKRSMITQRELGEDTPSFASALKHALRQDPDVILVGEMRDLETISLAISAAETGHLVLGTMHTSGAVGTIDRVVGSFPAAQQAAVRSMLSESLRAVVSQRLVMRRDRRARVPLVELVWGTPAVANLIREGRTYQLPNLIQLGRQAGMRSFGDSWQELAAAGLVEATEAHRGEA